jgi:hypothetical protein
MSTINQSDQKPPGQVPAEPVSPARSRRRLKFDDQGHAIPPTDEERAENQKALLIALAEMAEIPDDPPGSDEEFWRAIDEERPERPLFREFYEP